MGFRATSLYLASDINQSLMFVIHTYLFRVQRGRRKENFANLEVTLQATWVQRIIEAR
jgi:hypothetical protein